MPGLIIPKPRSFPVRFRLSFFPSVVSVHFNPMGNIFFSTKKQRINENGAFHQVAQPSAFAYAPSSSAQPKLRWDVFINHRGPDVKQTLAKAIYEKLSNMGLQVFLDEKALEPGDSIATEIQEAMANASLHVAIFSKRYAESPWCLAELSYMLKTGVTIIPIFYLVDPFDLRWVEKGIYARSFAQLKRKRRYTTEKVAEWKESLQTLSYIDGYLLKNDDWGWVLEGLANHVMAMSKAQVAEPTNTFGLEERVAEIEEMIQGESVHIVGIVGVGGCGKTTLAKELFNRKSYSIFRRSFLYDVRDRASKDLLSRLQKKLLENLGVKDPQFESIHEGTDLLAKHMRSLRALIVLDDVDCTEQIDFLLPAKDRLRSGSLVIITTRNAEVLTSWGISERSIYRMKGLSSCHAKKLFCLYALQTSDAPDGFEDLVERALESCEGLPLSLKVFGGQLRYKPRDYWESQLNEISRVLPKGVLGSLKISYDALDPEEQERFLDVACFFTGEIISLALQVWDGLGRRKGVYSWETLQNKCLVELDEENRIRMHDHLRDLGREIADKTLPNRIWYEEQINIIRTQAKERMQVRGIMAATTSFYDNHHAKCSSHYPPPFEECVEVIGTSNPKDVFSLKYLIFNNGHFNAKIGELSRGLVWLRCFNFNHANLSSCLSLGSLRVLELYDVERLETIWENERDAPLQLRELTISINSGSSNFQGFPLSIERLKYLKTIAISGSSMTSLPNEFCNLNSLEYLELNNCRELSSLPISFGNLSNLRHLFLRGCFRINMLPLSFKELTNLRYLNLYNCTELTFNLQNSSILQNITKLEHVQISLCKLEILPRHVANQLSMTKLEFKPSEVRDLPANIGQLKKLEELSMGSPFLTSLPDSFGNLSSLKELKIHSCQNLGYLPDSFGKLSSLEKLEIYSCPNLRSLPGTFGDLSPLRKVQISSCPNLKSLPATVGSLNALEELDMKNTGVESLPETFGQLANLRILRIKYCPIRELAFGSGSKASLNQLREIELDGTHLSTISISEDCCPSLEILELCENKCLTGIETLPKSMKRLNLRLSPEVEALNLAHLTGLKELEFKVTRKAEKVEGFEYLRSLESLIAHSEWEVPAIQSLEHMDRLTTLELSASNFAALEPCIRTIKKWPSEMQVWAWARARTINGVESIVKYFPFVDSFTHDDDEWALASPEMQSSDAAIVCFAIECVGKESSVFICDRKGVGSTRSICQFTPTTKQERCECKKTEEAERGVWVWTSLWDSSTIANEYYIGTGSSTTVIIKKATLVVGEKECIIEAFKKLLVL